MTSTNAAALLGALAVRLRKGIGLSQDEIAQQPAGPSSATQNALERGKSFPTEDTIWKLQTNYEQLAAASLAGDRDNPNSLISLCAAAPAILGAAYAALRDDPTDRPITLERGGLEITSSWDQYGAHHHWKANRSQLTPMGITTALNTNLTQPVTAADVMSIYLAPALADAHLVLCPTSANAPQQIPPALTEHLRGRLATFGASNSRTNPAVAIDPLWPVMTLDGARQLIAALRDAVAAPTPSPWAPIVLLACITLAYKQSDGTPVPMLGEDSVGPLQILDAASSTMGSALDTRLAEMTSDRAVFADSPRPEEVERAIAYLRNLFGAFRGARFAALDADLSSSDPADSGKLRYRANTIRSAAQLLAEPTVALCTAAGSRAENHLATWILGAAVKAAAGWEGGEEQTVMLADPTDASISGVPGLHALADPTYGSMHATIVYADRLGLIVFRYQSTYYAVHCTPR